MGERDLSIGWLARSTVSRKSGDKSHGTSGDSSADYGREPFVVLLLHRSLSKRHRAEAERAVGEPGGAEEGEEHGDRDHGAAFVPAAAQP